MEDGTGGVSGMVRTKKNAGAMVQKEKLQKAGLLLTLKTRIVGDIARKLKLDALSFTPSRYGPLLAGRRLIINQSSQMNFGALIITILHGDESKTSHPPGMNGYSVDQKLF